MPEHVHVYVPHELGEPGHVTSTRERVLEVLAARLLSLATLGTAWSGYQAAKWIGLQARRYTPASTARSFASRAATIASQDRTQDLLNFNRWLEVSTDGNTELADDALHNATAIASPRLEKNYVLATSLKADKLEALGDVRFEQGKSATENADDYVFATVFFAIVLFFAGISLRFAWLPMRLVIMGLGLALLAYGAIRLGTLPTL